MKIKLSAIILLAAIFTFNIPAVNAQYQPDSSMTVVAIGIGATEDEAMDNARENSVIAASELLITAGKAYTPYVSEVISKLIPRHEEFVESMTTVTQKSDYDGNIKIGVMSKINQTKLAEAIDSLNSLVPTAVSLKIADPQRNANLISSYINSREEREQRLTESFADVFSDMRNLLKVNMTGLSLSPVSEYEGMIPFLLDFDISINMEEYNRQASMLTNIILNRMGGSLVSSQAVTFERAGAETLENYTSDLAGKLGESNYAVVAETGNNTYRVDIYNFTTEYADLFKNEYNAYHVISNPYDVQINLQLLDAEGGVICSDNIKPFMPSAEAFQEGNIPPEAGTYPMLYLIYRHQNSAYRGKLPLHTNKANLSSVIITQAQNRHFIPNPASELQSKESMALYAVTAPFIIAEIPESTTMRTASLQYVGLISMDDVKRIKNATVQIINIAYEP